MKTRLRITGIISIFIVLAALIYSFSADSDSSVEAAGAWNGQDLLHVPMSWCVLEGSPAEANPNIAGDTDTDAVIWRRHERPTDNIYTPQAGISLRSAINNSWGSFNFPIIPDTDQTNGTPGDVNGWDVNSDGAEFNALINACDTEYTNIGKAGIGVTAVNVGLFHDNANPANDGNNQWDYQGIIGWGGCAEVGGNCVVPYDGRIMVIDNNYLYPTVPDRTFPPSPADPGGNLQFVITDSKDVLTGHEVGHALSLDHVANTLRMMNPSIFDNTADGDADNTSLSNAEVNTLRANAMNVPGLEIDPPNEFLPGDFLGMRLVDRNRDAARIPAWLDVASVKVSLNQENGDVQLGQQMMGLIPRDVQIAPDYAFLMDSDNNQQTGASTELLKELGIPSEFQGADLVVLARTDQGLAIGGQAWNVRDGELFEISPNLFQLQIQTLVMHPQFADVNDQRPRPKDFRAEVNHTIAFLVNNTDLGIKLVPDKPFRAQVVAMQQGEPIDKLDDDERGGEFVFELPSFPHCFPQTDGVPGGTVEVIFDGLLPNQEIHALVGPDLVLDGVNTDANGGGTIQLPIPNGTTLGLHLVTIGHDKMALTADCTVLVNEADGPQLVIPDGVSAMTGQMVQVPVILNTNGFDIAATAFSVDFDETNLVFDPTDGNADGIPDSVQFMVPASFQRGVIVNLGDTDGELDFSIFDQAPPIGTLPDGVLATIEFTAVGDPGFGNTLVAPVIFSTDPVATFGDPNAVNVPGTTDGGSVIIMGQQFGDCNGDGNVNAADITGVVLEIFDGDGTNPANAPGGTFVGTAGCDANNNGRIAAADITCVVLVIFRGPGACGGDGQGPFVKFMGIPHRPLGQARLNVADDRLTVSNIGSSGEDGVSVDLPINAMSWTVEMESLDSRDLPDGAGVMMVAKSEHGDQSPMGRASAEKSGNGVKMTADFPLIDAKVATVEVYNNGQRVATFDEDIVVSPRWPIKIDPWIFWLEEHFIIFIFEWDEPGPYEIGGQQVIGDEIRLIPSQPIPEDMMASQVDLLGRGIGSMTIVGEEIMPVHP